jgi:hypothetical protein
MQAPNVNTESVRKLIQWAIDILECSKSNPTFPIDIPTEDDDLSTTTNTDPRVKLHFAFPFHQIYHPKYA